MSKELAQIQGLLAHAVASQMQDLVPRVPHGEGEHTDTATESIIDTPLRNGREKHFGVALAAEHTTQGMQLGPQFLEIVDFAVERYPEATRVLHGLASRVGQVDDRETPVGKGDST